MKSHGNEVNDELESSSKFKNGWHDKNSIMFEVYENVVISI